MNPLLEAGTDGPLTVPVACSDGIEGQGEQMLAAKGPCLAAQTTLA